MISILLSYARDDDEAFVRRLHADLTRAGFDVWFDRVSMPSRQLTFHQEIRDAIAARERLLLVVGPGVLASDYVTQEWRFAYFEAGKCVNPVVRLNGRHEDGSVIDGYELIPEDLKLIHAEDFRDDAAYDVHLANLIRQLSEPIPPVGKLVAVPELPACFITQPDRIKALRDLLLVDLQKPVVVSGVAARVGLQGMGGIGKSVLASALAHRPEVRRAFPDGIFWITLGQKPQLAELQRWLARELGDEALFPDERSGKECLRKLLAGRKALLVLDDVWQREDAEAFNVIGAMGRILLTTRDAGLVTALASKETHYRVELPTEAEAETIFEAAAHLEPGAMPAAAREIVAQCGRLPLALALCGGMVQGGISPADVLEALREHDLEFLSSDHPAEEQHRNAWKAMDVSLRVLPPEQRDRFAELAVFALDRGAPEAAVVTLWEHTGGLSPRHARKLLADFAVRSLVLLTLSAEGDQACARMTLHDLLHNFASGMAEKLFGSRAALHKTLLDAYRKKCLNGWPSGPDDGYFFQNLCEHLLAAWKLDDAVELLTGLPWIEAKCKAKLVFSLQDDYRNTIAEMPEAQEGLRLEREREARLARWTEEITEFSRQWSKRRDRLARGKTVKEPQPRFPQPPAACRLWTEEEIKAECQRIIEHPTYLDRLSDFRGFVEQECYPLVEFGTNPGFVVQHAFNNAPGGSVHETAAQALPAANVPLLVRRWSDSEPLIPRPALLRTLEGHTEDVGSVSMTPNGRRAISGSLDRTLRVWDMETGISLHVLVGHISAVKCVCLTPDGGRAVSGSNDTTLRVWDLGTGTCLQVMEGHTSYVNGVSVTADCRLAISGSEDKALRVWNLETGVCLRVLEGHTEGIKDVGVTPDGRRAISAGWDSTLRVWDLETGLCLRVLEGHRRGINSVGITSDGRCAVSASNDRTLRVWDLETGASLQVLKGHTDEVWSVSLTPDGRRAVSAGGRFEGKMRAWDLETGECLSVLDAHTDGVRAVNMTSDGGRAVSGGDDETVRLWDLDVGAGHSVLDGHTNGVRDLSVTPDGLRAVSSSDDTTLRVWDLDTGKCLQILEGHTECVSVVSVTPDGRHVVSASEDKTLRVWDLGTGECLYVLRGHKKGVTDLSVTLDSRRAVSGSWDSTLRVWDLETGLCLRVLEGHVGDVHSVNVTPDGLHAVSTGGQRWFSGCSDFNLRLWDLETGLCLRVLEGHTDDVHSVNVTPDGLHAVSASDDRTLRVWDLETGLCLRVLEGHTKSVRSVRVTPDGRSAVSTSMDETIRLWDLESGTCLRVLEGHSEWVRIVRVTADGWGVFSTGNDLTLRVWNLETGACLAIECLKDQITSIALPAGREHVVVGTSSGEVIQFGLRGMILTAASQFN